MTLCTVLVFFRQLSGDSRSSSSLEHKSIVCSWSERLMLLPPDCVSAPACISVSIVDTGGLIPMRAGVLWPGEHPNEESPWTSALFSHWAQKSQLSCAVFSLSFWARINYRYSLKMCLHYLPKFDNVFVLPAQLFLSISFDDEVDCHGS